MIDPLPQGVEFAGFMTKPIGTHYRSALNRVEWAGTLESFAAPITITFEVTVTADLHAGQRLTNTLWVDSGAGWAVARSIVTAIDYFDLSSSAKEIDRSTLAANGLVTYTLRVQNPSGNFRHNRDQRSATERRHVSCR